jgi:hypothetical protein
MKPLFFGIMAVTSGAIIAGGLFGEWWAFASLPLAGAYLGWKIGET